SVVTTLIIMIIILSKHKMIKQTIEASIYIDENSIKYTKKEDNKIQDYTRSYSNSTSSSSSSNGGSSIGSSGRGFTSGGGRHG
ncbi:MAG: hypothetical protein PUA90_01275, partial [bacterium]|nr:hypothetical protein [bacterium]